MIKPNSQPDPAQEALIINQMERDYAKGDTSGSAEEQVARPNQEDNLYLISDLKRHIESTVNLLERHDVAGRVIVDTGSPDRVTVGYVLKKGVRRNATNGDDVEYEVLVASDGNYYTREGGRDTVNEQPLGFIFPDRPDASEIRQQAYNRKMFELLDFRNSHLPDQPQVDLENRAI